MNFHFARPGFFFCLLLLLPLAFLFFLHFSRRYPVIAAFTGRGHLRLRYICSTLCFILFCASMITALAEPRMGSRLVRKFRRGSDVVLAFDVSRSMQARDSAPVPSAGNNASSRLERSLWIARGLIEASGSPEILNSLAPGGANIHIRFAVAFGKGQSVLAVPLTSDTESVLSVLEALSSDSISSRGTNLETLVDTASGAFIEGSPAGRQIILFSDGEGLSGSLSAAVERAKKRDITVIAIAAGSIAGALIGESSGTSAGGKAGDSTMIRTYLHAGALRSAVERSDGTYIDGNSIAVLRILAEAIFPLAGESSWVFTEETGTLWHIFVLTGLFFLALGTGFTHKSRHASVPLAPRE
ncbi:MAG: VWA domain-containing protein [Spirochaetaceae bacterium]|jgi:Ca-activated chloride channel family protein|nr:VWA domain-containing protein [Spirochaetaceae bacterium]